VQYQFCYDEPDGQIMLHRITAAAENIAQLCGLEEAVMDGYRRTVFSSRPHGIPAMTLQEIQEAKDSLLEFVLPLNENREVFDELKMALDDLGTLISKKNAA
jgi:hypothetical protein